MKKKKKDLRVRIEHGQVHATVAQLRTETVKLFKRSKVFT